MTHAGSIYPEALGINFRRYQEGAAMESKAQMIDNQVRMYDVCMRLDPDNAKAFRRCEGLVWSQESPRKLAKCDKTPCLMQACLLQVITVHSARISMVTHQLKPH